MSSGMDWCRSCDDGVRIHLSFLSQSFWKVKTCQGLCRWYRKRHPSDFARTAKSNPDFQAFCKLLKSVFARLLLCTVPAPEHSPGFREETAWTYHWNDWLRKYTALIISDQKANFRFRLFYQSVPILFDPLGDASVSHAAVGRLRSTCPLTGDPLTGDTDDAAAHF